MSSYIPLTQIIQTYLLSDYDLMQMGLETFSSDARIQFELGTYDKRSDILEHLASLEYARGTTNTAEALR